MGATLSNLTEGANGAGAGPGLGDIPECCVACVFMYLTPPEICNLARLNRAFRGAASSDSVWESKLPPNYQDMLSMLPLEKYENMSKKNIFALLSRSVPLEDGSKEVWLDRVTGGLCMSVSAKGMVITGIDDRRYWNWIPTEESRFHVVAFLQQIWWFEVDGVLKFPFPAGVYTLSFRLHLGRFSRRLGRRICNFEHTHGWEKKPVKFELSTSDGQQASCDYCLDESNSNDGNSSHKRGFWTEYKKLGGVGVKADEPGTTEEKKRSIGPVFVVLAVHVGTFSELLPRLGTVHTTSYAEMDDPHNVEQINHLLRGGYRISLNEETGPALKLGNLGDG